LTSLPPILALALVAASCGNTVAVASSGTTTGTGTTAHTTSSSTATATVTPAGGCLTQQECSFPIDGGGFVDATCLFDDPCLGPLDCFNNGYVDPPSCAKDADCTKA